MKKGIYLLGLGVLLLLCMDLQAKVRLPHFFSTNTFIFLFWILRKSSS